MRQSAACSCWKPQSQGHAIESSHSMFGQAFSEHLQCWAELAGDHGIVAVEVTSASDAAGLPCAALSPVLDAWRITQDIPVLSAAQVLEAAAAVGLLPQSGCTACCYSRHACFANVSVGAGPDTVDLPAV